MVDVDIVTAKLVELQDRLGRVRERCPEDAELFEDDRDALELVSFNLILAIQACLDIASHLISDEGWPPAGSLAESFVRLEEHGVLSAATTQELRRAAGLRNILTHMYSSVDPIRVHQAATRGIACLEGFSREVSAWIAGRGGD